MDLGAFHPHPRKVGCPALRGVPPAFSGRNESADAWDVSNGLPRVPRLRLMARTARRARPYPRKVGCLALRGVPPAFSGRKELADAWDGSNGLPRVPRLRLMARTAQRARPYPRKVGCLALRGVPPAFNGRKELADARDVSNASRVFPDCA